ncbi:MAG: SH3 domain-containing protein [Phycisphaerae bacterium]|nr:SH3 domain-containing protein [Phycisphaerae bacterium]
MVLKIQMIGWITLTSSAFVSLAVAQTTPSIAGQPAAVAYPFIAELTGNDVYIRSGRGPGYYHCGQVNRGDQVTVVEEVSGWAKILPLPENYSWIHKNYVRLDPQNRNIGTVTGDNVRVWAGSDFIDPIRSFSIQTRLNTGELVDLFDPAQPDSGDYYKIKSPTGAYLWISSEYLRYVGPIKPVESIEPVEVPDSDPVVVGEQLTLEELLGVEPRPAVPPASEEPRPVEPEIKPEEPEPTPVSKEVEYLQRCYQLADKINAEVKKPINEQDYSEYKQQLIAMTEDPQAGRAATHAQILIDRIERFELAIGVTQTLKEQDARLEQIRAEIERARQAQVQRIGDPQQRPLFTGTVRPSFVYAASTGQKRYLLTDNEGLIQCYMLAAGPEIESRLEQLVDSRISIRGEIISDPQALVTLVSVTSIQMQE